MPSKFPTCLLLAALAISLVVSAEPYLQSVHNYGRPQQYQYQQQQHCDVPPDFWCDSYELARRCNVVQQCEAFKQDHRPLKITLMYEALCPYCQRFIANNLGNLHSRFGNRTQLDLVPWGNALLLRNGCNHGEKECDAHRMMSCVIEEVDNTQAVPFIICFERSLSANSPVEQAMHHCSGFVRDKYRQIKQCYVGERGRQLQRQAAQRTMSAKANPIVEVPYLLVNDYAPNTDANAINILSLQHLIQKWLNLRRSS